MCCKHSRGVETWPEPNVLHQFLAGGNPLGPLQSWCNLEQLHALNWSRGQTDPWLDFMIMEPQTAPSISHAHQILGMVVEVSHYNGYSTKRLEPAVFSEASPPTPLDTFITRREFGLRKDWRIRTKLYFYFTRETLLWCKEWIFLCETLFSYYCCFYCSYYICSLSIFCSFSFSSYIQ